MGSLLNMGNMGGESFAENISGKVLVKYEMITVREDSTPIRGHRYITNNISIKGSGIASVHFVYTDTGHSDTQKTMGEFCIKVDGITLHDYMHFKDYRRGSDNFDFLTIPFAKSIEIGFPNNPLPDWSDYMAGDIASVIVWQDED